MEVLRYEKPERNRAEKNASTASTGINQLFYVFYDLQQLMGGGENRGYYSWGKLPAEKENRPLESVGKVRGDECSADSKWRWILDVGMLFILINRKMQDCKVCKVCKHVC